MEDLMMKWVAALSAHRGVNKQVCECLPWFAGRAQKWPSVSHKSCSRWWELVLRPTALSQSSSQDSGSHQVHTHQKKRGRFTWVSRHCWFLFLMLMG
jgi:hypothetical protein